MPVRLPIARRVAARLAMLSLVATLIGCGDASGLPRRYPVSGTVTYKGQPVAKGTITFSPVDDKGDGRSASGVIQDGQYQLTTHDDNDGAIPGKYQVTIAARDVDQALVTKTSSKEGGSARQDDVAAANKAAKDLIPAKYNLGSTSGLERTVEAKSNSFDFPLSD